MLLINKLYVYYEKTEAIKDVSLNLDHGKVVTLLGANGAGKTTVLNTISGFINPTKGEIEYENESIRNKKPREIVKKGIVQVSQERDLFSDLSVLENLKLGAVLKANKRNYLENLERVFENFQILKERKEQKAGTLSGGEQQMLAIGRAIMSNPKLLLLDEPTTGLAPIFVGRIKHLLETFKKNEITMLLVEQNISMAISLADYFYVLRNGQIVTEGNTDTLPENLDKFFGKYYI